jgi:hypothetical protein
MRVPALRAARVTERWSELLVLSAPSVAPVRGSRADQDAVLVEIADQLTGRNLPVAVVVAAVAANALAAVGCLVVLIVEYAHFAM